MFIYNIYLPLSIHANEEALAALLKVLELLELNGEHVILEDFNLYYPF